MIHGFKQMPELLQKQVLVRLGLCALSIALLAALIVYTGDMFLALPFTGLSAFFAAAAFALFRTAVLGEYVVVSGKCAETSVTVLKRRAKYIVLDTDECKLKVMLRGRMRKIPVGAEVKLYIANKTPIYDHNGLQVLYTYIAMESAT